MNPAVVIATHKRIEITRENIRSLQIQSVKPQVIVVVSDPEEGFIFSRLGVYVVVAKNNPLGRKWQAGVDFARKLMPSHLVVTGSDDILCRGFMETYCKEDEFSGLQCWYIWDGKTLYFFDYMAQQALGGGRVYSRSMLDKCDWKIFDTKINRLLDDYGWVICTSRKVERDRGCILAVKGNWTVMNPLNITLTHPNAKLRGSWTSEEAIQIIKENFDYDPKGIL